MFKRKTHHDHDAGGRQVIKGAGLARGPALILGTILAVAGLLLFLHAGDTPTGAFPDGDARGDKVAGFEANGWTAFFTTTAGVVLLFGAAQHLLAKALGLVVGIALAACVVLDLVDGPGVLGLAAANWAVDLGWGVAAVLLLLNVFAPRITHEEHADGRGLHRDGRHDGTAAAAGAATRDHHRGDDGRVTSDDRRVADHGGVGDGRVGSDDRRVAAHGGVEDGHVAGHRGTEAGRGADHRAADDGRLTSTDGTATDHRVAGDGHVPSADGQDGSGTRVTFPDGTPATTDRRDVGGRVDR